MKHLILFLLFSLTLSFGYTPKEGFVPDPETAIAIAAAVWSPIYGKEKIESQKPFTVKLIDGVWHVDGTKTEHRFGGTAHAEITKSDGKILNVIHGK
ncbi:MAG: YbbC/YhhH family protein [Colwellia sp.]